MAVSLSSDGPKSSHVIRTQTLKQTLRIFFFHLSPMVTVPVTAQDLTMSLLYEGSSAQVLKLKRSNRILGNFLFLFSLY